MAREPATMATTVLTVRHDQAEQSGHVHSSIPLAPSEESTPSPTRTLGVPPEFSSFAEEIGFVCVCSMGQLLFAIHLAHSFVNQLTFIEALGTSTLNTPWLIGSFLVANGVSVVISGSFADLVSPKYLTCGAFVWLSMWSFIGAFSISPERIILFFIARSMAGLSVGTLCAAAMSMLGRVYRPGLRKNRVFSLMGAMIPMGFAIGAIQGGAFNAHLHWVFGSTALLALLCVGGALWCIPSLPVDSVSLKDFDYAGASAAMLGCGLLIFGLTQGSPTHWSPYTYALVIVGLASLATFGLIEKKVRRHWILMGSMLAFATGPAFFLPQTSGTMYWALSFPGFVISTFGPDMSFAAVSVFITSNVPRSYQGAAGSLVITAQNLSTAVFAALGDTVGEKVTKMADSTLDLGALRAIWWMSLATAMTGAQVCACFVRIPKSEEKEHVS
ncbi:putative MFS-type transporter [Colletotrichum sp. SAR 10_75]|nr:putative MFS-type transporter [Colletotrichum sp. SAR 10_75]